MQFQLCQELKLMTNAGLFYQQRVFAHVNIVVFKVKILRHQH